MHCITQDSNFSVEFFGGDTDFTSLNILPFNKELNKIDDMLHELHSNGLINFSKYISVTKTISSTPKYSNLVNPFFTDYIKNHTERHDYDYDKLLVLTKKMLKRHFKNSTSITTITKLEETWDNKEIWSIVCGEITSHKQKWKRKTFTFNLRLYEFSLDVSGDDIDDVAVSDVYDKRSSCDDDTHSSSSSPSSISASGCGCCDECGSDCKGECGCDDCCTDSFHVKKSNDDEENKFASELI